MMFQLLHTTAIILAGGLVCGAFFVLLQHINMQENIKRQDWRCDIGLSVSFLHCTLWGEICHYTARRVHHVTATSHLHQMAPWSSSQGRGEHLLESYKCSPIPREASSLRVCICSAMVHYFGTRGAGRGGSLETSWMAQANILGRSPTCEHRFMNPIPTCPVFYSWSAHISFACSMRHTKHECSNRLALFYFLLVISLTKLSGLCYCLHTRHTCFIGKGWC